MKRNFALLLTALLAFASLGAMAESADYLSAAQAMVPEGSTYLSMEKDDGHPEYKFFHTQTATVYEVTMDAQHGTLRKLESEKLMDDGSRNVTLTETDVKTQVLFLFPDAQDVQISLHKDDSRYVYKVRFDTQLYTAEVKLHPESGVLLEQKLDYTKPVQTTVSTKPASSTPSSGITADDAARIAIQKAGGGDIRYVKADRDDGRSTYEGELIFDGYEYEFEIDAESGKILEWDRDRIAWND